MAVDDRAIELVIEPRERPVGRGVVRRLLPFRERRMVGPFIFFDVMGPEDFGPGTGMDIDAHPHIGLSTLTYLLAGRAVHRDSTGVVQPIEAGAVNWMTAGGGVSHTERSHPDDRPATHSVFGAQLWVALPADTEDGPAAFEHCAAADVPVTGGGAVSVRVAAGAGFGEVAPIPGSSPLMLADVRLDGGSVALPADHPERAVVAMDGDIRIDDTALPAGHLAVLEPGRQPILSGAGVALVLGGEPVGRRHIWWNFVHSDRAVIDDARRRWQTQDFPRVPGDHEPWVPLPGA